MENSSVRPTDGIERIIHTYGDMLFRLCFVMLGCEADAEGNVIAKGDSTEFAEIINGKAEISISAEGLAEGNYKLIISSFIGVKKADQQLNIFGEWECEFAA